MRSPATIRCWLKIGLAVLLSTAGNAAVAAELSPFQVEDLYRFDAPQSLVVAPGEEVAVYVRQWIDPASRQERNSLWLVAGDPHQNRPLERDEPDARSPVFAPDGQWIAFRTTRPHPIEHNQTELVPLASDPATDLWLIRTDGQQVMPLAGSDKPYGRVFNDTFYGGVAFSPDGGRLAFIAEEGSDRRSSPDTAAAVQVVRPDQGEGYTGYAAARLWVAELAADPQTHAAARIRCLTLDDAWYGDPQWSADGSIIVHANRTADRESVRYSINKDYNLWRINVDSGAIEQLTFGPGPEVSPRLSPDGRRLACLSGPRKGPHADVLNLAVVELGKQPTTTIVFNAHDEADGRLDPAPLYPLPDRCWDGDQAIVYSAAAGTRTTTMRHDLSTSKRTQLEVSSDEPLAGLTSLKRDLVLKRRLTPPGNAFLKQRLRGETRVVKWKSRDGLAIEGVFTVPHPSLGSAPYKLVVMPHGGPHSRSSEGFNFTAEVFAAQGYAVLQPNFRGSAGYGRAFLDADRNDLGGGDMDDILTGIESLVRDKIVDPQRQFLYGVSYGGYMTTWLVGQTNQFRAAAAQNAVTDLTMMWCLSDLQSWTEWELQGRPWDVPESMRKHSPLTYVAQVNTPTLILNARDDRRCPLPMGRAYHQALLARGVPTQLAIYPDEGHGIKQPRHREDVLRRVLEWFAQHDVVE